MTKINETLLIQVKEDLKLTDHSKNILHKLFGMLPEGLYSLNLKSQKKVSTSRYKYYWGHVLLLAVNEFNKRSMYQIEIEDTGEIKLLDCTELHEMFKQWYNPVIRRYKGMRIIKGGSTRNLSDSEFIGEYLEKIICFLAEKDVICQTFDEWAEYMRSNYTCAEIVENNLNTELKY
jgi:hypothetical protein